MPASNTAQTKMSVHHMDHMNKAESPEVFPQMSLSCLSLGYQNSTKGKDNNCSINSVGKTGVSPATVGFDFYVIHKSQCKIDSRKLKL